MRRFAEIEDLSGLVREALGSGCRVAAVDRLRGGSKKGVYRVRVDGAGVASVVVYSWAETENFWPAAQEVGTADPLAPASGLLAFLAAQRSLNRLGVRVPRLLLADDSRHRYRADVAVVEDVCGGPLEGLFDTDPARAAAALGMGPRRERPLRRVVERAGRPRAIRPRRPVPDDRPRGVFAWDDSGLYARRVIPRNDLLTSVARLGRGRPGSLMRPLSCRRPIPRRRSARAPRPARRARPH